jgi:hypothetical protein
MEKQHLITAYVNVLQAGNANHLHITAAESWLNKRGPCWNQLRYLLIIIEKMGYDNFFCFLRVQNPLTSEDFAVMMRKLTREHVGEYQYN